MIIFWDDGAQKLNFPIWTAESLKLSAAVSSHPTEAGEPITDHVTVANAKGSVDVHLSNTPIRANEYGGTYQDTELSVPTLITFARTYKVKVPKFTPIPGPFEIGGIARAGLGLLSSPDFNIDGTDTRQEFRTITGKALRWPAEFDLCADVLDKLNALREARTVVDIVMSFRTITGVVLTDISPTRNVTSTGGKSLAITISFDRLRVVNTARVAAPAPTEPRAQAKTAKGAPGADAPTPQQSSALYQGAEFLRKLLPATFGGKKP